METLETAADWARIASFALKYGVPALIAAGIALIAIRRRYLVAGVPDQFTHAGATIYVEYKAHWTEDDYSIVGDFLEGVNPRVRTARQIAVMRGLKKLTRNRKEIKLKGNSPFPLYKDEETGDTLIEALCRRICAREPMLLEEEPFSMAFAKFAPEDEDEEEPNPTPLPRSVSGEPREERATG